jgi:hypothetical protein
MCWKNISQTQEYIGEVSTCVTSYLLESKKASINNYKYVLLYKYVDLNPPFENNS